MKIVLGLGNPGERYARTRHNLGFRVADVLVGRRAVTFRDAGGCEHVAWLASVRFGGGSAILAKPRTMMNRSGRAGLALCRHFDVPPEDLLVVHDDADLDLGRIRLRSRGGPGGHNGIRSLIDALDTDTFPRVKLGVRGAGRSDEDLADYVLEEFVEEELPVAAALVELGADAVETVLDEGLPAAMNRFNARSAAGGDAEAPAAG